MFARRVAGDIVGESNVREMRPIMGAEDFSHMLNKRPGAFIMIGNGVGPGLHNPGYNFNDDAIPFGVSYWVKLAETRHAGLSQSAGRETLLPLRRRCPKGG